MATDTTQHNIFCDFLNALGVPYTSCYSSRRFGDMPFKSLFGMSKLLKEYGVESKGVKLDTPADIDKLSVPFIASTGAGFIIVTGISGNTLTYMTQGVSETMPLNEIVGDWDGTAFPAFPDADAAEPDYAAHRRDIFIARAKSFVLWGGLVALFLYLFISNGLWRHVSTVLLTLLDLAGLYLTWLLLQKSLKIHNPAADRVCRVLQEGGCDTVLETKASSFFGIFSWSEVGFTYFSVSLLALLIFPQWICYLAACNILCLPFTFWSIWYQKFRARNWCTLCVSVQATLWLLFFCYLGGGWIAGIFPLRIEFFVLGVTYAVVLMALNRILPRFEPSDPDI